MSDGGTRVPAVAHWLGGGLIGVAATASGLAAGWGTYSALAIDHRVPLASAIAAERREFRSAEAGRISYYVAREGAGRPLVPVHSVNAASAYEMRTLFEVYRRQRPVYALDLPGFGFSGRADLAYSPATFVAALADLPHGWGA